MERGVRDIPERERERVSVSRGAYRWKIPIKSFVKEL